MRRVGVMSVRFPLLKREVVWPVLFAAMVILASHRPTLAGPSVTNIDKITHFAVYGLLATLVCRIGRSWKAAIWGVFAVSAFGASDELHQSFVPGRSPELADWIADTLGAGVAVLLYWGWPRYRGWLETPLRFGWRRRRG